MGRSGAALALVILLGSAGGLGSGGIGVARAQPAAGQVAGYAQPQRAVGIDVFGEYYPTHDRQQSVYTGGRLLVPLEASLTLVLDGGYVAAGRVAGDGDDGVAVGAGLEMALADPQPGRALPFV